ncbi:Free methionine-R-sulfoxide reductase [Bordetella trematum]|nr:Free methionine-R-sulfoxide reductase [Bordetella trematum]
MALPAGVCTLFPTFLSFPTLMFQADALPTDSKPDFYRGLQAQARALLDGEHDRIANAANLAALVWQAVPEINWAGFYFFDGRELVLGPSRASRPACASRCRAGCAARPPARA